MKDLIVLGELHKDLYYESNFYELLVEKIVSRLVNFYKYNPDDLNRKMFNRIVRGAFSETPKKIVDSCFFKRGGNGNNSSEFIAKLGIPIRLISVIGRDCEWMYKELDVLGVKVDTIFQIEELTPVNTNIISSFIKKTHLAQNLKSKMNFEGISIDNSVFENSKLIFCTPIAKKFVEIFKRASEMGLITAFNIEPQFVQSIDQLSNLIDEKCDIFFINLKTARLFLNNECSIKEIDMNFKKYAKIRIYTAGKEGSSVITNNLNLFFPRINIKEKSDHSSVGDCYAAGFLSKLYFLIKDKDELNDLFKQENLEKLQTILNSCGKFATYSATYQISKQKAPSLKELEDFIKKIK